MPPSLLVAMPRRKLLWIAGGIGLTPFLSMLKTLARTHAAWDIRLVLAMAEPDVLVLLVETAFHANPGDVRLAVGVFSRTVYQRWTRGSRSGGAGFFEPSVVDEREVYLCGWSTGGRG
ncbi:hypothetical protein B0H10DRAFT_2092480, partial [Mycena sp. CBHHK59/15]